MNLYNALRSELPNGLLINTDNATKTISMPESTIKTITSLDLKNSDISNLTGLENFTALTELNLTNNNITDISALSGMENLTILNLSDNSSIKSNISTISTKTSLVNLNISNIGVSNLGFISNLVNIQSLNISSNNINNLSQLSGLSRLTKLDVSNNKNLTTLDYILSHTNLVDLNISNTGIANLTGIKVLSNLEVLNVRNLQAQDLYPITETYYNEVEQEEKAYLEKISKLDFSYTTGLSFYQLSFLKNLTEVYMMGNNIYSIDNICNLPKLNYINLEENHIEDLSPLVEWDYNEYGVQYIKRKSNVKEIVLRNNNITNISVFQYLNDLDYVDLSYNHIYNANSLESKTLSKGLHLENQDVNINVYQKGANVDQYIILPSLFQQSKNSSSKIYAQNVDWDTNEVTLNTDSRYQTSGNFNVIISHEKKWDDNLSVTLNGGVADGSVIHYILTQSGDAIDSLVFEDENLCEAIYNYLSSNKTDYSNLVRARYILNIEQLEISQVYELNISGNNIQNLKGLESFINLSKLNASENSFTTIEPLKYCTNITELIVSNSPVSNNNTAISQMKQLKRLDLSNTAMTNINNINTLINSYEEWEEPYMEDLNISNNNLENIDGIEKFKSLQSLYVANNKISDISKLNALEVLKVLNVSNNNIKDITSLKDITTLRTLNISNNSISDISSVYRGITALYFSGNKVKDISSLSRLTSLTNLSMNNNQIEDISPVKNILINNEFSVEQQKIIRTLNKDDTGYIAIDLPQIFIQAKETGSKIFTSNDFEINNCTLADNKAIVNVEELGDKVATVRIIGGNAKGTTLMISEPIKGTITYSSEEPTNQNVTASISFNKQNVTITNNGGSTQHEFEKNGEFTYEFIDESGITGEEKANVTWIDKTAPELSLKLVNVSDGVEATITANEKIVIPDGWTLVPEALESEMTDEMSICKIYTQTTKENITIKDIVGNETSIEINITIDKTPPVITGVQNGVTYIVSVKPEITDENLNEVTLTKDGNIVSNYTPGNTINENGDYVLTAKDKDGNTTTVSFRIDIVISDEITSNELTVSEEQLTVSKIKPKTTVYELKQKLQNDMTYIITDKDENELQENSNLGTGYKIIMENGKKYELAVFGDLNGDAKISTVDVARLQKIVANIRQPSTLEKLAADLKEDNKITLVDLARMQKIATGQSL